MVIYQVDFIDHSESVCDDRLTADGIHAPCCFCYPHPDCKLTERKKADDG
jgi:hypothetical protein